MRHVTRFTATALLSVVLLIPVEAFAQGPTYGVKAGLDVSNVSLSTTTTSDGLTLSPNSKTGFIIDAFAGKDFTRRAGLVVEFAWAQGGTTVNLSGSGFSGSQDIRADYLSIPVLGRVNVPAGVTTLHVFFGPTFAFKTGDSQSFVANGVPMQNNVPLKGHDTGITAGAQFDLHKFLVDLRYTWGLVDISQNPKPGDPEVKTRQFAIMFGIDLAKKK